MRTDRINHQTTFKMVHANIKNNGRTGFLESCDKFREMLRKEGKHIILSRSSASLKETQGDYLLVVQCKKKNGISTDYKAENDLSNRIQNWALKQGFGKIKIEQK